METRNYYVIVNSVSAEILDDKLYLDESECLKIMDKINKYGVYICITLEQHIESLMTWFNKGTLDLYTS